jgi:ABC-type multidrug transport system fused ATPase/permease subunit
MQSPERYDSRIGDKGLVLSGGKRQRILLARAFLRSPKIILLDEATSALDSNTECKVQEALTELCRGRTTIVVAHRLSTVIDAEQIVVLENGKVVGKGTHVELMSKTGLYKAMWDTQTGVKTA